MSLPPLSPTRSAQPGLVSSRSSGVWLEQWGQDFRFSFRSLRHAPGFSLAVIFTLALCIGANTTVMSVLYGLILKPLPFRDAGQLVEIYNSQAKVGQPKKPTSVAQYLDFKANADLFEGFALWRVWTFNIGEESDPSRGIGARVTADYFGLLGVQPLLGRFYTMEECAPGKDHVVVLTQSFWETQYRSDPSVVGREIRLSNEVFTIVGVAPRRLEALNVDATILKPFEWAPALADPQARSALNPLMYARVKTGVARGAALSQLATLEQRFFDHGASPGLHDFLARTGQRVALGQVRAEQTKGVKSSLLLLQGGALFVLLLGCVNVTNLMLARANSRQAEFAVRQALGAGRGALARQLFTEGWLLALAGAMLALALAWVTLRIINTYTTSIIREVGAVTLDGTVLGATLLVSFFVALAIGLLPVVRVWRTNLLASMQSGARGASGGAGARAVSGFLVTAQVALALMLLIGAGLLIRSFAHALAVDPGFDAKRILHGRIALNSSYGSEAAAMAVQQQIVAKMREIPAVEAVSVSSNIPIGGQFGIGSFPLRGAALGPGDTYPTAAAVGVSPDYFATMGIPVLEGRGFRASDNLPGARRVFVVDQNFAQKYFPGRSAVGEGFAFGTPNQKPDEWPMIIGVVGVMKFNSPDESTVVPLVYQSMGAAGGLSLELRTKRPMAEVVPIMRAKLRSVDASLPLYSIGTMQMAIDGALANRRGVMWLLGAFAGIALILSAVGIYGMLAYDVTQRTKEIGIRGAIGASRGQIVGMILRQGLWKTGIGLVVGLGGAFFLSRAMSSLLFDVKPTDPVAFAGVSLLLLLVSLVASWLPARRAAAIDPVIALRAQ